MSAPSSERPTAERPLLVGLLIDVSASMLSSIENRAGRTTSRLESFRESMDDLVERAKELSLEEDGDKVAPLVRVFAYGFGFNNVFSFLFGADGPTVRDLLELPGERTSTVPIDVLAENWPRYQRNLERLARSMAGNTPMGEGFRAAGARLQEERSRSQYTGAPVLFVLSDGDPTDLVPSGVAALAAELKESGTTIVSCYVTDQDVAAPRHLYGKPASTWPDGARLMFACASNLPSQSTFEAYLREYDWELEDGCRLFTQINQSEVLTEFLNVVLSPLREEEREEERSGELSQDSKRAKTKSHARVFVSYSHQDKKWLDRLRVHLRPLERAGLLDLWDDTRIGAGDEWRDAIVEALNTADVAVLLVSADFLASDFISTDELPQLLEARQQRGLTILPLIVSPSQVADVPSLARYQAFNAFDKPLNQMRAAEREKLLVAVGKRIRDIVS